MKSTRSRSQLSNAVRHTQSKFLLYTAFGAVLGLFLLTTLLATYQSAQSHEKIQAITQRLNVKVDLVDRMHFAARERSLALFRMINTADLFDKDEIFMVFHAHGATFADARLKLLQMELNNEEKKLLKIQGETASRAVPTQNYVMDLILNDELEEARKVLTQDALPEQNKILGSLQQLKLQQKNAIADLAKLADDRQYKTDVTIFILGALAIGLGILIAFNITGKVVSMENSLNVEKKLAEITLGSIGDAVITTDEKGIITAINIVAENLTGYKAYYAIGKHALDVFQICRENNQRIRLNPVAEVLVQQHVITSDYDVLLQREDHLEFAIEYTISPILDEHNTLHGSILVFRDVTEMRSLSTLLSYQATHDPLTGLINRREFERRVSNALQSARANKGSHALCFMDLDQLKLINDSAGHAAGDELLKQIANRLSPILRNDDVLARLGGDEFGVLLEDCNELNALEIAEILRKTINDNRFAWGNNTYDISISIGIVLITADSGDLAKTLAAADTACLLAKERGRNRIEIYYSGDEELKQRRNEMRRVQDITNAIEKDQLVLYYQAIKPLDTSKNEPHFCEVLVRMLGHENEIVPPMSFIPAGERFNLMPELDKWVINKVLDSIDFAVENPPVVSINLSGQSIGDKKFVEYVYSCIKKSNVPPESLCFEITETAAIDNMSTATHFIQRLREIGCKFALDDFGSGLSSFSYLKNMPVDYLKIDGSFVRDICHDPIDFAFVESIHRIGEMMQIETIAEYVESEEILNKLKNIGISYVQGYYTGSIKRIEACHYYKHSKDKQTVMPV